jgi:hypothetical protein
LPPPTRSTGYPANSPTQLSGDESPAERKIRAALLQPTQIEFVETPLKDVVDYLKELHHIEIQLDTAALKEAGVDESAPVTKNLKGISLRSALKLLLDELQLKYVIHNEVLLITSPAKAESDEYMITKAYPVGDLVVPQGGEFANFEPLKETLTSIVAPKTWTDNGGTGDLREMVVGNRLMLVLSQTQEVHEQIEQTLEMLRKAGGLKNAQQHLAGEEKADGEAPEPSADRPAPRIRWPAPQPQGVGGMGGGMGGGMMGMGDQQTPFVISVVPGGDADLLGGLKGANAANQRAKVQHLKQRQDAGNNGGNNVGGGVF